jgi:hypothetical protein
MSEYSRPQRMAANTSYRVQGSSVQEFLCTVSGTLTVTDADGTVHVDAIPVTAGVDLNLKFFFNTNMGGTVSLAGGAAGTLLV